MAMTIKTDWLFLTPEKQEGELKALMKRIYRKFISDKKNCCKYGKLTKK
jgi:hypothetical protein